MQSYLKKLGVESPVRTLKRWTYEESLIDKPKRKSMGRGRGRISCWSIDAAAQAAGIWTLRGGVKVRKTPRAATIKKVQRWAQEVYKHPVVLLSLRPDKTLNDDNPTLEDVEITCECPPVMEPFLVRYLIATEKARRNWPLRKAAIVSFEWTEHAFLYTAEGRRKKPHSAMWAREVRELKEISVKEAPCGDELRFLIDGNDVRDRFLWLRQQEPEFRSMLDDEVEITDSGDKGVVWRRSAFLRNESWEQWEEVSKRYKKGDVTETELEELRTHLGDDYKLQDFCKLVQTHIDKCRLASKNKE